MPAETAGRARERGSVNLEISQVGPARSAGPSRGVAGHRDHADELAAGLERSIVAGMTAHEVIDQIKALPPEEKTKVVAFMQHEIEERLLTEETPEMLAAIDEGIRSLDQHGGREYTRAELEQKVRQWARGASR